MKAKISESFLRTPEAGPLEMVERKGLGHPDSVCDALAEALSGALCRAYWDRFGRILHYNVDKALLRGGASTPVFGGGEVTEPIDVYMAGRAVAQVGGETVDLDDLVRRTAERWLSENLRALDVRRHVRIHNFIRPGSQDLTQLFARAADERAQLANDTSFGAGFAPFTRLERTVMAAERFLTGEARRLRPEVGEDVKVMGVRMGDDVKLTVACAFVSRHVRSLADYAGKKADLAVAIQSHLAGLGLPAARIVVNAADDVADGRIYLTVTGTSAEAGDDGQVGRGNRANGLITPYRPMTLEATAGKNPVTHVGKLYNECAQRIAERLVEAGAGVAAAECYLVSDIGSPVEAPLGCDVRLSLKPDVSLDSGLRRRVDDEVGELLQGMRSAWRGFLSERS